MHLDEPLPGTIAHNPRSNMNNAVGYARPSPLRANPVVLGTDGIGADMLDEFRLAYVKLRESDVTATPQTPWCWLENGWTLFPEARATTRSPGRTSTPTILVPGVHDRGASHSR